MNLSFPLIKPRPRRRTFLLGAGIFPFLLTACAKIVPNTQTPIDLAALLAYAQRDIILILSFLQVAEQTYLSDKAYALLQETLRVRREQEKFLITASHSSTVPIQADHLPPSHNPHKPQWRDIPAQLHRSSEHAKNLCLQREGEISAVAASICASCVTLTSDLSKL